MDYKRIDKLAYKLHLIKTDKFKSNYIEICFKRKVKKEEITLRNMLSNILIESSKNYPTNRLMEIRKEELYGTGLGISSYITGNYNLISIYSCFLDSKYTDDENFKEVLNYIFEIIFNPNVKNNCFNEQSFLNAKKIVEENIKLHKEDPNVYSFKRCLSEMDDKILSYDSCGYLEDLEKITPESLYEYYQDFLKKDIIDIFIIGNQSEEEINKIFTSDFLVNTIKREKINHYVEHKKVRKRPKKVIETKDYEQSSLVIGFKLKDLTDFERKYVSVIYNYILGGATDSLLFNEVREKNSLCYSVYSSMRLVNNIMTIRAGIDKKNLDKTVKIIKKCLKQISLGNFEEEKIEAGKTTYISSFDEIEDSLISICNMYISHEYLGYDLIDERKSEIVKVTKEDIMKFSEKIYMDTIFFLEGDSHE